MLIPIVAPNHEYGKPSLLPTFPVEGFFLKGQRCFYLVAARDFIPQVNLWDFHNLSPLKKPPKLSQWLVSSRFAVFFWH